MLAAPPLRAVIVTMTQAEVERALGIARGFDRDRARFHVPYVIALDDATVQQIEVVTEFRRIVLFTESRIRAGDHMTGVRQVESALASWHGKVTIVAQLRFHPLNTFVASPPYQIGIGAPTVPPLDNRRVSIYAPLGSHQKGGTHTPLTGATVEVDFDAAAVGQKQQAVRIILEGKEVLRTTVDFGRLE